MPLSGFIDVSFGFNKLLILSRQLSKNWETFSSFIPKIVDSNFLTCFACAAVYRMSTAEVWMSLPVIFCVLPTPALFVCQLAAEICTLCLMWRQQRWPVRSETLHCCVADRTDVHRSVTGFPFRGNGDNLISADDCVEGGRLFRSCCLCGDGYEGEKSTGFKREPATVASQSARHQ